MCSIIPRLRRRYLNDSRLRGKELMSEMTSSDASFSMEMFPFGHCPEGNSDVSSVTKVEGNDDVEVSSIKTEFSAIALNDRLSSEKTLSCKPTVSSFNDEIDFKISFDDSDDEDYTVIFDKNSFSYKIISVNNLTTDSENDNEKVNMPSLPSPKPTVSCFDDLDFFKYFENEFPAIVYNDAFTSKPDLLTEPTLSPQHIYEFGLTDETSLSKYDEVEQNVLYFNDLFPFNIIQPDDLKSEKDNDDTEIDIIQPSGDMALPLRDQRHQYLRYKGLQYTDVDIVYFEARLARIYRRDVHRVQLGRVRRHIRRREFILALGLHTAEEMETVRFGAYWAEGARQIPDKGDLRDYWIGISSAGDFLGTTPSYNFIRDSTLRLFHRLITCSIVGRSQAPEKVLEIVCFEKEAGSNDIWRELPVIDMGELVRLQICEEIDNTWAWVALGPERQPDAATGAPEAAKDAPAVDEGNQGVLAPVQEPLPPPAPARTLPQRMARLEEDVHEIRGALVEQREVIGAMAKDFSRFTI
ncbi:hypothetical protein Tco_0965013 [Tanacetum coccineum]